MSRTQETTYTMQLIYRVRPKQIGESNVTVENNHTSTEHKRKVAEKDGILNNIVNWLLQQNDEM
jgi:hypothetical protein